MSEPVAYIVMEGNDAEACERLDDVTESGGRGRCLAYATRSLGSASAIAGDMLRDGVGHVGVYAVTLVEMHKDWP